MHTYMKNRYEFNESELLLLQQTFAARIEFQRSSCLTWTKKSREKKSNRSPKVTSQFFMALSADLPDNLFFQLAKYFITLQNKSFLH